MQYAVSSVSLKCLANLRTEEINSEQIQILLFSKCKSNEQFVCIKIEFLITIYIDKQTKAIMNGVVQLLTIFSHKFSFAVI